jgi:hypothetical protein
MFAALGALLVSPMALLKPKGRVLRGGCRTGKTVSGMYRPKVYVTPRIIRGGNRSGATNYEAVRFCKMLELYLNRSRDV